MAGIVNRLKNWVDWLNVVPEGENEDEIIDGLFGDFDQEEEDEIMRENIRKKRSNLKVVSHPAKTGAYEVRVVEPTTFEESLEIVNNLRDRKSIILNLHLLDAEQSQRVVDFVSGATHALDGNQQRIGEGVFLFTPHNVCISAETEKATVLRETFGHKLA